MDACALEFLLLTERDEIGLEGGLSKDFVSAVVCEGMPVTKERWWESGVKMVVLALFYVLVKNERVNGWPVAGGYRA